MNAFCLILILAIATAIASPIENLHSRKNHFFRKNNTVSVVGGFEAVPHSLPYQAALLIDSKIFCGGILISTCHILTAAHCTYGRSQVQVILGAHNYAIDEDTQQVLKSNVIINHENYCKDEYNYDISLVKLPKHIRTTDAVKVIPLADSTAGKFVGSTAALSGWGCTNDNCFPIATRLRKVFLSVISNSECGSYFDPLIRSSHLCTAGYDEIRGDVGACFGDSGGPLVVNGEAVGIVSFGLASCVTGKPSVYTRISYFREWITKHSGI